MSGGGGGAGGGKGAAAAGPVPQASKKLVQGLKEIVNRPEAEIYAALRECGMDPDEAVSRLLSQDTFQEVKSKRDKKKEVKETPEPRSRAANSATSRGVRGVPDRGGRNSSVHHSSTDNMTSRSSVSGPGMPSTNSTQKQTVPSSSVNKNLVSDAPSVPPQTSSGFQHGWAGTPGQLSMADIVKMGRPQAQGKPSTKTVVTADKGYAGQYPSLPSTVNQNIKQSASTVPPTELDQGLPSAQNSVLVKDNIHTAAANKQNYDNDWSLQDEPLSGNQPSLPETSGDPSLYEAPLHPSSLVADVVYSHEKSYLDENISAAVRSVNSSERPLDHYGGNSEYNDGLLQNSSTYLPQTHSHIEDQDEESNADVSAAANFQGLSLHDEELAATKFAEDNPAVIIPDHLQVANSGCAGLSFGSFESGAFSGLLPQKSADNNSEFPAVEESEAVDHTDTRDQDFYEIDAVNPSANENLEDIMGANAGNLDVPSVPQTDVLRQEILDDPSGVQYNLPSVSSHHTYSNPAQPNSMEAMQGSNQAQTLQHLSSLLQANTLQHNLLGSNMPPLRDLDFGLSPLLAAQSMGTRYNSGAPTTTGQAISMQEPLKSGVFSNTQSTQNLPSASIQTGPPLPQQLVHPYSQPTLPIGPFANMIGYNPYLAQNYPAYLPSTAFQQYSSNGQFHQSATAVPGAGMKYSMPQYKNNLSDTNLQQQQQQPSSVISGYGGFGTSSNLPANFALNQSATPAATNPFDEVMSAQYKAANQYMAALQQQQQQQGDNSAMWHHGAGSRTASALPPTQFYGYQGQSQQQGGFRQAQQPQQPSQFGGHGYPAFYHSQGGMTQEHHPQNPAEGSLNGYQAAPSQQPSHQSWQQHTNY
ncbi:uncharacterized protein LOC124707092 isoform X3 [Lolium rigidum]|uniref:uncharacterized protein LOC124707092 isoform X3 n=1 Tax=Lolium rigidum TaxID=89674 RepID=UPI001F5C4F3F|nr:uncharacterized protein LOC124707092 isoform X3 [Lolium rigidum]